MSAAFSLARDVSLREWNTFRLEARADCFATVHDAAALPAVLETPELRDRATLVLGRGSNVLLAQPRVEAAIVHLAGASTRLLGEDSNGALVHVDAGCEWDALVDWTLAAGLRGLENLALIPGQAGAAPIQNIGAYGVEIAEFIGAVHVYERSSRRFERLARADCRFGYRDSLFKQEPDRHIVTALELQLPRGGDVNLGYAGLQQELDQLGGLAPTPQNVALAVRRIRRRKLPDPDVVGNAGSFFKNPVVPGAVAAELQQRCSGLPVFPSADGAECKLSAAWLIERAGWRGYRDGAAGISAQHALVLVNHGGATGPQLLAVARRVAESVESSFGVRLEPEPRIVGATFRP